ncbi:hypothetical protein [Rhodococcus sp. 27YEA15]|uniref:hypothetical protein n=1 Tax=Rhodococcus sp. 27YEA15 TaxID=3156259 RepID=UPI003C7A2AD4
MTTSDGNGLVPGYLGTSAACVGGIAASGAQGGTTAEMTDAILVSGLVLAVIGVAIYFSADPSSRAVPAAAGGRQ